ncbi:DsbA family protein [Sphaerothrix gracilis]|uniref:DsbA family protein n=1 Tax=Sphaerothrix gracilis TaxID=3151835 RepID=UPI0031FCB2FE
MSMQGEIRQVVPPFNESDHLLGNSQDALILMEYGDYQCPQSGRAYELVKRMQQQLAESFCFVFRHFPQQPRSLRAAESAEAAAVQDKFWEMHDLLFQNPQQLEDADLVECAERLQFDIPQFLREMAGHVHVARVQADIDSGRSNGVEATPIFFIGVRHQGTQNLEAMLLAILQNNNSS